MTVLDASSDLALVAVGLLTLNACLGLLMAVRYSPYQHWPHRRINIFLFHRWTAYLALAVVVMHPAVLLLLHSPKFRIVDLLLPVKSPSQPTVNTIGAIALYLILIVLLTSLARLSLGRKLWKRLHYMNYPAAIAWFVHGLLTDTKLKNRPTDWLDAEKFFIEACFALIVAAFTITIVVRRRHQQHDRHTKAGKYSLAQAVSRH
ncbi:MAG TPA: ferric reductase-like transmembrane domain-containing protein [Terriglobales bacterium]|nr:ferric reductase-like transmembrane domain-containing protein [Terriglobales bacterium]